MNIALGSARGLAYLHEDSSPRVIHRDFKASNILLEHDFTPKVSDFGLARTALEEENSHISTRVMGTFGYDLCLLLADICDSSSRKSDIFIFSECNIITYTKHFVGVTIVIAY